MNRVMHKNENSLSLSLSLSRAFKRNLQKVDFAYIIAGVLISATVLTGAFLPSIHASADDVVDQVTINVPISCTLSGTGMTSHTDNILNGQYSADIGTTTLKAFCNDANGFAIYAAGYTGDEIGATNSNKLVGASTGETIVTGTATSAGNPDVSNWAMKLTTTGDSGDTTGTNALTIDSAPNTTGGANASFSQYHIVPNEYTKVAHKNSATDMTASTGGATLTTTYAAYISQTQPADTYSGKVIYTLVHPSDATAPLPPIAPPASCTTPVPNLTYMQDLTSSNKASVLASMIEDQQYFLADKRDSKSYCVAKLKDGNIWMTQNLDLNLDSNKTYTNLDTDIGYNESTGQYETASWTPIRSTYAPDNETWLYRNTEPESYDAGKLYWNGVTYPTNREDCEAYGGDWSGWGYSTYCDGANLTSSTGDSHFHLGNYYNWTAAVAMNDSSSYTAENTDVNQSICPTGWTLPKSGFGTSLGTSSGSFQYLIEQYGWDSSSSGEMNDPYIWESAIYLPLSDSWRGGVFGLTEVGSQSFFWSSVIWNSNYGPHFLSSRTGGWIDPSYDYDYYGSGNGFNVRCIAR